MSEETIETTEVSEETERFVEPNSGAAPQPGGFAGAEAVEEGHGSPGNAGLPVVREEEPEPEISEEKYEPPVEPLVLAREAAEEESSEDSEDSSEGEPESDGEPGPYDPSEHTAAEVNQYLEEHPDEIEAVIAAERAGKNRKSVTGDE